MRIALLILLLIIAVSTNTFCQATDTIFVAVDSTSINKRENTFDYILIAKLNARTNKVCRVKNRDYSIEFEYDFSFSDGKKSYICYTVYDLPTGITWSYIFDKKTRQIYLTDKYDLEASGDTLIKSSIDLKRYIALVKPGIVGRKAYKIKLHLLN